MSTPVTNGNTPRSRRTFHDGVTRNLLQETSLFVGVEVEVEGVRRRRKEEEGEEGEMWCSWSGHGEESVSASATSMVVEAAVKACRSPSLMPRGN